MATSSHLIIYFAIFLSVLSLSNATRPITDTTQPMTFQYHKGPLLSGKLTTNLIWYGHFTPAQRAIISDFITSLSSSTPQPKTNPSVASWWNSIGKYHRLANPKKPTSTLTLSLGKQVLDQAYSLGKSLTTNQLIHLSSKLGQQVNAVNIILTSSDVTVDGFCSSRCGSHGSNPSQKSTYIWVGNSESQCPGQCAWPFHQPIYGPQGPPLVAPNNDVGLDGMVINLASLLAGTVTNPFGNGYFQGPKEGPLEASSACTGIYAKGAYPGYPGNLLVDPNTGASYNANGVHKRKYLLPALYDPTTSSCSTLV